jgi:hypothetical protein
MTTRNINHKPWNIGEDMKVINNCEFHWPHHRKSASEYNVCLTHDVLIHKGERQVCPMRGFMLRSLSEMMRGNVRVEIKDGLVKHVTFTDPQRTETWSGYRETTSTEVRHRYTPVGDLSVIDINEEVFWHCEEVKKTDRGYC